METSKGCPAFCTHVPSEWGKEGVPTSQREGSEKKPVPVMTVSRATAHQAVLSYPLSMPQSPRPLWSAQLMPPPVPPFLL